VPERGEIALPESYRRLLVRTQEVGFDMPSTVEIGTLLRLLAASKPGGHLLELGTGTGLATAFLLGGMDDASRLVSVDIDASCQDIAKAELQDDARVRFVCEDGAAFIERQKARSFDLVFADAWPGKFSHLDKTLDLVALGGFYIGDDLRPHPNWPEGHQAKVETFLETLEERANWTTLRLDWGTGLLIAVRTG
jgi:predicted O-methyltransferase YrrM